MVLLGSYRASTQLSCSFHRISQPTWTSNEHTQKVSLKFLCSVLSLIIDDRSSSYRLPSLNESWNTRKSIKAGQLSVDIFTILLITDNATILTFIKVTNFDIDQDKSSIP